ncbi:TauD/TfdA family dioxygenase [Frankia sp. CNm7]|uniref:TauD/TfdA family dioxygenase n=1 Tax=Frankia nepalensis TaxID=1836974 RepID=A0A937UTP4_9ACTN|nr:TauD/TfdA family dioxygenase [Frankia nepalensis]MBL7500505.1 TauD/TfdA family dioxygenase [Frankia nepalensis]MBL7511216.1 TauD/TfdA family dioxygenase [Frankia nepalensis]MBL7518940.1 TauD/TfdA family dioxygenase [Frankia nepalensis]MBL7631470.1 TauD/TfdA family dioxygenase [Frankia nepalensis]
MITTGITVQRQAGALGALVTGVDLAAGVDDETFGAIYQAFLDHHVICLRGQQDLTPAGQLAFAARWGTVSVHPYVPSIEGHPGLMRIYDPNPVTQTWHADTTHTPRPPALTLLLARAIPPYGGDTMWSNAHRVYEDLSPGLRETLDGLRAVHRGTELAASAGLDREAVTTTHPVAARHPVTGRRALFANANYTVRLDGWSEADSAPLLRHLYDQVGRPEYVYRHKWRVGDLVIWDNRATQHSVVGDTAGAERTLHRVTIEGDVPA